MSSIMIIDDDIYIGNMVEEVLRMEGYEVLRAYSGTEALLVLEKKRPDLILLDLMLPGMSGEEVLPKIVGIPVIITSAKTGIEDKVALLMAGAADYLTKPFDLEELKARIIVQLRKNEMNQVDASKKEELIEVKNVSLDPLLMTVSVSGDEIPLTRTELAILRILMVNAGRPIGRNTILDRICMDTPDCTERSLKQHISNIRKKMQASDGFDYIQAVYGIGFKFVVKED